MRVIIHVTYTHLKGTSVDREIKGGMPNKRNCRSVSATCIICGETCVFDFDKKNNSNRWRQVGLCGTADRGDQPTFRQTILDFCGSRQDEVGFQVKIRLMDCQLQHREINSPGRWTCNPFHIFVDARKLVMHLEFRSVQYVQWSRRQALLLSNFSLWIVGNTWLCSSGCINGAGVTSLLLFRSRASNAINLVVSDEADTTEAPIHKIAANIAEESNPSSCVPNVALIRPG